MIYNMKGLFSCFVRGKRKVCLYLISTSKKLHLYYYFLASCLISLHDPRIIICRFLIFWIAILVYSKVSPKYPTRVPNFVLHYGALVWVLWILKNPWSKYSPVMWVLRRLRREDHLEFVASLGYVVNSTPAWTTQQNTVSNSKQKSNSKELKACRFKLHDTILSSVERYSN